MNYRLIVVTHGDSATLPETLRSFVDHVTPPPTDVRLVCDTPVQHRLPLLSLVMEALGVDDAVTVGPADGRPSGFCNAVRLGWRAAQGAAIGPGGTGPEHVFWLEHDFRFLRPVDLADLALVLDAHPKLAQMALMRGPVNTQELAAGGLYQSRPGQYAQQWATGLGFKRPPPWLQHTAYFTTNPSLMRRDFMARHPFPGHARECEGLYGIELAAADYTFGVWGTGTPWVEHFGVRTGFGY